MGRFEYPRRGVGLMPEYDSIDGSPAQGTGNGGCASWRRSSREDTGNRVCGSSRDTRASPVWRGVDSLRSGCSMRVSVDPCIAPVTALYGSGHWKQGVSGAQSTALRSRVLVGTWSGNAGGESA